MSTPAPVSTYVFGPDLDHSLTVLLGLDLTGPDNLNVEMFWYKGVTSFYHFKVILPRDFRTWSYLITSGSVTDWQLVSVSIHIGLSDILYYYQHLTAANHADIDTTIDWTHANFSLWILGDCSNNGDGSGVSTGIGSSGFGDNGGGAFVPTLMVRNKLDISTLETYQKRLPCDTGYPKMIDPTSTASTAEMESCDNSNVIVISDDDGAPSTASAATTVASDNSYVTWDINAIFITDDDDASLPPASTTATVMAAAMVAHDNSVVLFMEYTPFFDPHYKDIQDKFFYLRRTHYKYKPLPLIMSIFIDGNEH